LLSRLQRVVNRFVGETSFSAMLSQELRLCRDDLRELAFERGGDVRVKLLASSAEQGALSDKDSRILKFMNDRPHAIRPDIERRKRDRQLEPPRPRASRIEIKDAVDGFYPGHM